MSVNDVTITEDENKQNTNKIDNNDDENDEIKSIPISTNFNQKSKKSGKFNFRTRAPK